MRRVVALLAAGLVLQMNFSATAESTRDIWLAPLDQDHSNGSIGVRDFAALFRLDAPRGDVANRVTVFKLYPFFTSRSSDEELTTRVFVRVSAFHQGHARAVDAVLVVAVIDFHLVTKSRNGWSEVTSLHPERSRDARVTCGSS